MVHVGAQRYFKAFERGGQTRAVYCHDDFPIPAEPTLHPPEQVNVFNDLPIDYPTLRDGISIHW